VIPSIGRPSIKNTIQSLIDLHSNNWNAIIVFDGVDKESVDYPHDERIKEYSIEKVSKLGVNHAGNVRNYGIKQVETSEWIGFVDDDDSLGRDYIDNLKSESKDYPDADCVVFRGFYSFWNTTLPQSDSKFLLSRSVGITFAAKKKVFDTHKFVPGSEEDYNFLQELDKEYNILLSPFLNYFVRSLPFDDVHFKNRSRVLNPQFR
jgi:hypothetical protein